MDTRESLPRVFAQTRQEGPGPREGTALPKVTQDIAPNPVLCLLFTRQNELSESLRQPPEVDSIPLPFISQAQTGDCGGNRTASPGAWPFTVAPCCQEPSPLPCLQAIN